MKKILSSIIALILIIPTSAHAASLNNRTVAAPTVAILDTALDTSLPIFKDRVLFEACVLEWPSCPNGTTQMEGPGSAVLPANIMASNGFSHGTEMAALAVAANPNVKIVFVRIIGVNKFGNRQNSSEITVYKALDWVLANKDRFNIQAVSMSQGHHNLLFGPDYCPKTTATESRIQSLANAGIPVFLPAGNQRDYSRIDWPACIPAAIAVGATMPAGTIAIYTNHDPKLTDFYAQGTTRTTTVGGKVINIAGTSASTVTAATQWATVKAAKPTLTYSQIYDLLVKTSKPTYNSKITSGRLIDLAGALNG